MHFKREKTGPQVYNVEYTVQALKCQNGKRPLTDEEKAAVAEMTPIDELLPRPTADAQKEFLDKMFSSSKEENVDPTIGKEFDIS